MLYFARQRRPHQTVLCAAIWILATTGTGQAQVSTARVQGVAVDPSDAVLPGTLAVLTSQDTGQGREARTDNDGRFQFLALPPGHYLLRVVRDGFAPAELRVEVTLDARWEARVSLQLANKALAIAVSPADESALDRSATSLGRTVTAREIENLPVPTGLVRDVSALAMLSPGIVSDSSGAGIAAAGQTGFNNSFAIEGLSADSAISGGALLNLPSVVVREFRVVSNQFAPEFGQASGAVVNVITQSGTNTPAGRLYYYGQDAAWNATSPTARRVGADDPGMRQSMPGGFFGGPLVHNRTFALASAEYAARRTVYVNTSAMAATFRPDDPVAWPIVTSSPKIFGRVDTRLRSSNALTMRGSRVWSNANDVQREIGSALERGRSSNNPNGTIAAIDTHVLGSSAVNEVRLQWSSSLVQTDAFCDGCVALNYPDIKLGKPANAPQEYRGRRIEAADVVTWLASWRGHHTVRMGTDVNLLRQSGVNPNNTSGTYVFKTTVPFDPLVRESYPSTFTRNLGDPRFDVRETIVSVFGQDEWQVGNAVTVNIGARWDGVVWPGTSARRNDLAPRLGIALIPGRSRLTLFRAALGRFFDESQLPIARDAQTSFIQVKIENPGFQGDLRHFDPYAPSPFRGTPAFAQISTNGSTIIQTPYTDQVSVGMQRKIGHALIATADLVRALGHRLPVAGDLNYPDPITHVRPDKTLQQIIVTETRAQSWYSGLQTSLTERAPRYSYGIAYTWASSENDTDGRMAFPQDQSRILDDRGPSVNNARHRLATNATVELPLGFHVSSVLTTSSALPYNITTGALHDDNHDGVFGNERPNGVHRNSARGSAAFSLDVHVSQSFGPPQRQLELFAEGFNVTNHANWTDYNGVKGNSKEGLPANAGPPRQVQVGLRARF